MDTLSDILRELEVQGLEHDARTTFKPQKLLNITRDTGEFLAVLVKANRAKIVLEVGTSNAYSSLWIANALPPGGSLITIENLPEKIQLAKDNIHRAGFDDKISLLHIDASDYISQLHDTFDLIFLDANRNEYMDYADALLNAISPGGLLICDNAISHADELASFIQHVNARPDFTCCTVPVGKGEFLATKA